MTDQLPPYVRGLLAPGAYPHAPATVELVQTHISYVFLAGDRVYKTKKPVDFGFIDQVAPERREQFCHAEVALNRRLAPDVYLGVVPVVETPDGFRVDPPGGAAAVRWWSGRCRCAASPTTARSIGCLPSVAAIPAVRMPVMRTPALRPAG